MLQRYKRRSESKGPRQKEKVEVSKVTKGIKEHIMTKVKDTKEAREHIMMAEKEPKEIKVIVTKEVVQVVTPGIGKVKTRGGAEIVNSTEELEAVKTEAGRKNKATAKETKAKVKVGEKKTKQKKNLPEDKATLPK